MHYKCEATMTEPDSLYALYVNKVVPTVLFTTSAASEQLGRQYDKVNASATVGRPQWFVFGTGALTYDIYVSFRLVTILS